MPRWDSPEYAGVLGYKDPVRWLRPNVPEENAATGPSMAPIAIKTLLVALARGLRPKQPGLPPLSLGGELALSGQYGDWKPEISPEVEQVTGQIDAEERAKWAAEPRAPRFTRSSSQLLGQAPRTGVGSYQGEVPTRRFMRAVDAAGSPTTTTPTRLEPRAAAESWKYPEADEIANLLQKYQSRQAPEGGYVRGPGAEGGREAGAPVGGPQTPTLSFDRIQDLAARKSAVHQLAAARGMARQLRMGRPVAVPMPGGGGAGGMADMLIRTGNPQLAAVGAEMLASERQGRTAEAGQRQTRELAEAELASREREGGLERDFRRALGLPELEFKAQQAAKETEFRGKQLAEESAQTKAAQDVARFTKESLEKGAVREHGVQRMNYRASQRQAYRDQDLSPVDTEATLERDMAEWDRSNPPPVGVTSLGAPHVPTGQVAPQLAALVNPPSWVAKTLPEGNLPGAIKRNLPGAISGVASSYDLSKPAQVKMAVEALKLKGYQGPDLRQALYDAALERRSFPGRISAQIPWWAWLGPGASLMLPPTALQALVSPKGIRKPGESSIKAENRRRLADQLDPIVAALESGGRQ